MLQWRLAHFLGAFSKEVVRMGHKRWKTLLRYVIVYLAVLFLLVYIGPKAC